MTDTSNSSAIPCQRLVAQGLRAHRAKLGLTQAQAAARSGLPLRTYRRFESSGGGNVQTFYAIAAAFGRAKVLEVIFGMHGETPARKAEVVSVVAPAITPVSPPVPPVSPMPPMPPMPPMEPMEPMEPMTPPLPPLVREEESMLMRARNGLPLSHGPIARNARYDELVAQARARLAKREGAHERTLKPGPFNQS